MIDTPGCDIKFITVTKGGGLKKCVMWFTKCVGSVYDKVSTSSNCSV